MLYPLSYEGGRQSIPGACDLPPWIDMLASPAEEGPPPGTGPISLSLLPITSEFGPNGLRIGGLDLVELVEEWGTPIFVYSEEHIRQRCREAVEAWGEGVAYASKAFLCKAMARLAHQEGMVIDVSTGGELAVCLAAGVPADRLVMHGNNKSEAEITSALTAGVGRIIIDSLDEIDRLDRLVRIVGVDRPRALLRVTPGIEAHTHEYVRTGQDDSKFGLGLASGAAHRAIARLESPSSPVELVGVHVHIGSQVFALSSFDQAAEVMAGFFGPLGLPELVIGGGLGVAYVEGEETPTLGSWAKVVRDGLFANGVDPATRVTAEPGRSIVAAAAVTCYRVGTIKDLPGIRTYVSVDGGMSDNPRPVLYGSGYEAFLARSPAAPRPLAVRIVGKHCESGDVIVRDARLPADTKVGDLLVTPVTGAYGHSMASNYNKVPRPPVLFVSHGEARAVVRRETFEDLMALDQA
jgi:diaminopimelate decarboxylase